MSGAERAVFGSLAGWIEKARGFLYGTWYGMAACWCAVGAVALVLGGILGGDRRVAPVVNLLLLFHLLVLTPLAMSAPIVSVCRRRWGRAIAQICVGLLAGILYVFGLLFASVSAMFSEANMETFKTEEQPWRASRITDEVPFSVEYRNAHPFLAEYEKRLTFRSGRHVPLRLDSGGAGKLAVYALGPDTYYLVEGLENEFMRCEYRVNVVSERVEMLCGDSVWIPIPAGAVEISSWGPDGIYVKTLMGEGRSERGEPAEGTLDGRRFLGYIGPWGNFERGGDEPAPVRRTVKQWDSLGFAEGLPFTVEFERPKLANGGPAWREFIAYRIAFRSGRWVGLWSTWSDEPHEVSVYKTPAGNFLAVVKEGRQSQWVFRVDAAREAVSCVCENCWVTLPEGTRAIRMAGPTTGADGHSRAAKLNIATSHGLESVQGDEPAGSVFLGCTRLGRLEEGGRLVHGDDGVFAEALSRTKIAGTAWNAKAELDRFTAMFNGIFRERVDELARYTEASPDWIVAEERKHRCAFRVFHAGDESCAVRLNLNGKKPGFSILAKGRCHNHEAGWYAAALALVAELSRLPPAQPSLP